MSLTTRLLLFVSLAGASLLQAASDYSVTGRVTDPSGAVVPRTSITFYSRNGPESYSALSDAQGSYSLNLPGGEYLMEAKAAGLNLPKASRLASVNGPQTISLSLTAADLSTTIVVTGTGTPQSLDQTAKVLDVATRSEMDARGVESVPDALRQVPGLRVEERGGPGANTTIQIRGLRTFDTAVLVDGMRFRDVAATQGDASSFLTDLLLVDTARVEVLQGAGSSLYGTNAIGGVVNVVTDSGGGPFHGSVTADGGGLGEAREVARLGGGAFSDRFHYSAGIGRQDVTNGVGNNGRYKNTTGNGLADYSFRPGLVLSARLLASDVFGQLYDSPAAAPARTLPSSGYIPAVGLIDSQSRLAALGQTYSLGNATFIPALGDADYFRTADFLSAMAALEQQVNPRLTYRVSYQAFLSDRNVVNGPLGAGFQPSSRTVSGFNGRIDTARAQANYLAGSHQLFSAAYEFEREYFASPATDSNPNLALRINTNAQVSELSHSIDAQDQIRLLSDRLQISLSGRTQFFTLNAPLFSGTIVPVYGKAAAVSPPNAYTADASVAYFIRRTGTKIRTHGGNGYRKPSLYELFGTTVTATGFTAYGDPRLKPERSIAIDGGIDQYFASEKYRLSASYFYTRLQQVIAFDSSGLIQPSTDLFGRSSGYRNTGGAMARGVELSIEAKPWRSTTVRSSYTYTNARDRYSEFADGTLQIPRVTPHSFSAVILHQFGKHIDGSFEALVASEFLYQISRRTFVFSGPKQLALSAGYTVSLSERLKARFYTRINNLADQRYYEDAYRTPGIWATGGFTLSF